MRITNVRAVQPDSPGAPPDWRTIVGQILVAVDTDVGITGYGVGGGGAAGIDLVRRILRDVVLDGDPRQAMALTRRMYRQTLPYGRKGLVIMAISGVDLAMWDAWARYEELPLARLLCQQFGLGDYHRQVPAYASLGTEPGKAVEQGFRAIKLHFSTAPEAATWDVLAEKVRAARQAIGPGVRLMIDGFMQWDVPLVLALAREILPLNVEWIEEPLEPDDFAGYEQLMRSCPIPIAGGEHEYMASGFRELIDRRLHAILQPDVTWCGGMSELVQIYQSAQRAGVRVCQHRGAEVWGLHAVAAFEKTDPLAEGGRTWLPWILDAPRPERGLVAVPDRPGFGIRVEEALLP